MQQTMSEKQDNNLSFIREKRDKEVIDRIQMEFYLFVYKLLQPEMDKINPPSQISYE